MGVVRQAPGFVFKEWKPTVTVKIKHAHILAADGRVVAHVDHYWHGGGERNVNVDGTVEVRKDPLTERHQCKLLHSEVLDRTVADELIEAESYEDAVRLGEEYAEKVNVHAEKVRAARDALR